MSTGFFWLLIAAAAISDAEDTTVRSRYAAANSPEAPNFRRHVVPLLGRLGCNGRACHGSFQGQGGFRLSLFGYDFQADHDALRESKSPRVDVKHPLESLMLYKPTHGDEHGGGERMKPGEWTWQLLHRWIEAGADGAGPDEPGLVSLEVSPREVILLKHGQTQPLKVVARWSDGTAEDVTPLCRYQTNDESIAEVNADGIVSGKAGGDTHIVAFYDQGVAVAQVFRPLSLLTGDNFPGQAAPTKIDQLVLAKLHKLGIVPSGLCSDAEFLRRVSLDLTGTLPTPDEIQTFLASKSPGKRAAKIEELLGRPSYVARWTTKLCEIMGNSPRQFQDQAPPDEYARHWYEWVARRVRENVGYDELASGIVLGRSRQPGETYEEYIEQQSAYYRGENPTDFTARDNMPYYWAKHTSRTPEERALNFSYAFLGTRIDCAQCHKHPFDRWTKDDFRSFTALFDTIGFGIAEDGKDAHRTLIAKLADRGNQAQRERARLERAQRGEIVPWKEVYLSPPGTRVEKGKVVKAKDRAAPRVLGGKELDLSGWDDPRRPLVEWMRRPDNPYFARAWINRVWAEYFGVGIIHPPDDMNQANPPSNAALLEYLVQGFVGQGFDMKWLHREIVSSLAYQRSLASNETNSLDERNFSRAVARRLPAELLFDALTQATANSEELAQWPTAMEERAIGPRGGALVGRYKPDDYAGKVFGRSPRDTNCDCSASHEPNLLQAIYLQNDKDVSAAISRKSGWLSEVRWQLAKLPAAEQTARTSAAIREAFLRTLSRLPTEAEQQRAENHLQRVGDAAEGLHEILWALLNTREFITNH